MRYIAEMFDRQFNFIGAYPVFNYDIQVDYVAQANSSVDVPPGAIVFRGNYIRVLNGKNVVLEGVIKSYTSERARTSLSVASFLEIFDFKIEMDISELASMDCESWVEKYILMYFKGSDTYQNLKGLTITKESSTAYDSANNACITENTNSIYNLMDTIIGFFSYYGLVMDISIDVQNQGFNIVLRNANSLTERIIKTDIPDVISTTFSSSSKKTTYNKIRYINTGYKDGAENLAVVKSLVASGGTYNEADNDDVSSAVRKLNSSYGGNAKVTIKDGSITVENSTYDAWLSAAETKLNAETKEITYYWHPTEYAGTIDTVATDDREIPVMMNTDVAKPTYERKDSSGNVTTAYKSFADAAYEKAYKAMYRDKYSNSIEMSVKRDSRIIEPGVIGQPYKIIHEGINYYSVLTGYERTTSETILTFGVARARLSQMFKLSQRGE